MEATSGATNFAKLEVAGLDPNKALPAGYANEFTVIFSDVQNCEPARSVESKEIISGPYKWYGRESLRLMAPFSAPSPSDSCFSLFVRFSNLKAPFFE